MIFNNCFPGQVVLAKEIDTFTKMEFIHPYIVWACQGFHSKQKNNIICFRVTTKTESKEDRVFVSPSLMNGLTASSAIVYNAEHLFDVKDLVKIGTLEADKFKELIQKRMAYVSIQNFDAITSYTKNKIYQEENKNGN